MATEPLEQPTTTSSAAATSLPVEDAAAVSGSKRAFDEIQQRAVTIHDLAEEDDELDADYNDEEVEVEEEEENAEEVAEDEEEENAEDDFEADEDVTVEELTEIVKEAGIDGLSEAELATKVLRCGKKIASTLLEREDINERVQDLAAVQEEVRRV